MEAKKDLTQDPQENLRELNLRLWDRAHTLELQLQQELCQKKWLRKQARKKLSRLAKYLDIKHALTPSTLRELLVKDVQHSEFDLSSAISDHSDKDYLEP
jgi:hypothetical protein